MDLARNRHHEVAAEPGETTRPGHRPIEPRVERADLTAQSPARNVDDVGEARQRRAQFEGRPRRQPVDDQHRIARTVVRAIRREIDGPGSVVRRRAAVAEGCSRYERAEHPRQSHQKDPVLHECTLHRSSSPSDNTRPAGPGAFRDGRDCAISLYLHQMPSPGSRTEMAPYPCTPMLCRAVLESECAPISVGERTAEGGAGDVVFGGLRSRFCSGSPARMEKEGRGHPTWPLRRFEWNPGPDRSRTRDSIPHRPRGANRAPRSPPPP